MSKETLIFNVVELIDLICKRRWEIHYIKENTRDREM